MKCSKFSLLSFLAMSMGSLPAIADVPLSYTHHGILKENDSLVNGTREITAEIVDESGTVVGTKTSPVEVVGGAYTMEITGIKTDLVAAASQLQLRITVDDKLLSPALKINAVPYATVAQMAKSLNTTGEKAAGMHRYSKDGNAIPNLEISEDEHCLCDTSVTSWDCGDSFEDQVYNVEGCYDVFGGAYQHYKQEVVIRPLDVVAIESAMVGIGTAQPEAPLHILSDSGESGEADLKIAGPNPTIMFDDMGGQPVKVSATQGILDVDGAINAKALGADLLNHIYPVGAIFTTVSMRTTAQVEAAFGGKWEKLKAGRVLWSTDDDDAGTDVPAGLPNITGYLRQMQNDHHVKDDGYGAFYQSSKYKAWNPDGADDSGAATISFDAERGRKEWHSNTYGEQPTDTIYGKSATVQPPAIKVYMFQRIE